MEEEQNAKVHGFVFRGVAWDAPNVEWVLACLPMTLAAAQQELIKYVDKIISTINPISLFSPF